MPMKFPKTINKIDRLFKFIFIDFARAPAFYSVALLLTLCVFSSGVIGQDVKADVPKDEAPKELTVMLNEKNQIRVRLSRRLTSGRIRIGDYVPLTVAENILVPSPFEPGKMIVAIAKDTPLFGIVVERKNRISFFRTGKFGIALQSVKAVDGTDIPVYINRPNQNLEKDKDNVADGKVVCKNKIIKQTDKATIQIPTVPCVRGRTYSGTLTGALPSAMAAAITTAALVLIKDRTAKTAAAVTLAGQIASQPGLSTVLNGVDAEMDEGEIYEAVVTNPTTVKVSKPK